ncbi:MAG: type II toxin-antitoxin system RelE/ParE family toxin [Acidaminococcaceae bacterium]|nr:type II toxin-antitoxin system RelE/ParE family toxin [Acidaminococcaceae bacterium]
MAYKLVVTENAAQQVESIVDYIMYRLHNKQAAIDVINDVEKAYSKLRVMPTAYAYCFDRYLLAKKYRNLTLEKHQYVILFQVKDNTVYVNGVFHMLENYREKL